MASSSTPISTYESVLDVCTNSLMSQIRNYTEDQLQKLLDEDDRLNAMIDSMPQVSSLLEDKEMKLTQSKLFAEHNLSMEPKLKDGCARLQSTYANILKEKQEVEVLKARLDSITEDRSLDSISAVLQAAVQEADDQSEALADKFQDGELEIDDFIKQFNEKRVLSHTRKVKSEKLVEILRQQQYDQPMAAMANRGANNYPAYPNPHQGYGASPNNQNRHSYYH